MTVIGLIVFVAIAINTFDPEEYVPAVGTAAGSTSLALPVFGGLAALALLAAARVLWHPGPP